MSKIQDIFDKQVGDVYLESGEYEGPLVITRTCVVEGGMATLWAAVGPVLTIDAPGVTIKNLRVEIIEPSGQTEVVMRSNYPDTVLCGIEVNGNIAGFPAEDPLWSLPSVIHLGSFAAGQVNTFSYDLEIPMDASLQCTLEDISIHPTSLLRGKNRIFVETREISANTILYGELLVKSTVTRRIYIFGKAEMDVPKRQAVPPLPGEHPVPEPLVRTAPQEVIAPALLGSPERTVVKGQKLSVTEMGGQTVKAVYVCRGQKAPLDVDGYVFLLQDDGKVGGDGDLIFFGNQAAVNGSVSVGSSADGQPLVIVHLDKVEERIHKIVVCFSIYGSNHAENFSLIDMPAVRVLAEGWDFCRFPLLDLCTEKSVVAMEFYRYKNEWKIHFVGAGYNSGLERLCENYGVEVE